MSPNHLSFGTQNGATDFRTHQRSWGDWLDMGALAHSMSGVTTRSGANTIVSSTKRTSSQSDYLLQYMKERRHAESNHAESNLVTALPLGARQAVRRKENNHERQRIEGSS